MITSSGDSIAKIFAEDTLDIEEIRGKLLQAKEKLSEIKGNMHDRRWNALLKLWQVNADFYISLCEDEIPTFELAKRSKSNIVLDSEEDVWVFGNHITQKSAKTSRGSRQILLLCYTADFIYSQLKAGKSNTIRELYYVSESWPEKFNTQDESNNMIECLEIALQCDRSDFALHAGINGLLAGPLVVSEPTRDGRIRVIDCMKDTNESGYSIHPDSQKINLESTTADFVIVIECGGTYRRLTESEIDRKFNCILVDLEGQPSRATKRIIKRLNSEMNLPVIAFLDSDPWSCRILLSILAGSTKTAHLSKDFATPGIHWMGIKPSDITRYNLPTDKLKPSDKLALQELLRDPRLADQEDILKQIRYQIKLGRKCEQQSLAKYGVEYTPFTYLPLKLFEAGFISEQLFNREYIPSSFTLKQVDYSAEII